MSQSLIRALELVEYIAASPSTLSQLAEKSQVHKTTVMRLLHDLEAKQFVRRNHNQVYSLGTRFFELSALALEERNIRTLAHPFLEALGARTGQTIHLAVLEEDRVTYVDKIESRQPVRMYSRIGLSANLHATGVAKVLLAGAPQSTRERIAHSIEYTRFTERTIVDPEELLAELNAVQQRGWAMDDSEHEEIVRCIAVPVRDVTGEVVAALSCTVLTVLVDREELLKILPDVLECAAAISAALGFHANTPTLTRRKS